MPQYTPNYNLTKPSRGERYNLAEINGNSDIIDSGLQDLKDIMYENVKVLETDWVVSGIYEYSDKYPYRASVALPKATSALIPDVYFASIDVVSGDLAKDSDTYNGGVYIYCKVKKPMTISRIILMRNRA